MENKRLEKRRKQSIDRKFKSYMEVKNVCDRKEKKKEQKNMYIQKKKMESKQKARNKYGYIVEGAAPREKYKGGLSFPSGCRAVEGRWVVSMYRAVRFHRRCGWRVVCLKSCRIVYPRYVQQLTKQKTLLFSTQLATFRMTRRT